jgi:Leucine-rich repeat (LRR) protein
LADVEVLQLQNNEIADLPNKIFHDLTSLNQLVLTGNSIVHISPGIFSRLFFFFPQQRIDYRHFQFYYTRL